MKILITASVLFCLCSFSLFAQSPYSIKGSVVDTSSNSKLQTAAISVLNSKDSVLFKFTWTGADGSFAINNLAKGKFSLLVTYPGYVDYVEQFSLDSLNRTRDFGKLYLTTKAKLLAEVIITKAPITIKGDTTEFNRGSFVVQPNSKVEDLLKQLPGMSVDKDGKITAQGKTVTKVLVDGEEFFSDDPTFVTRNIRGDMVEKIQLYDKKSDQATFTGVDDGVKTTTLNVVLREDSKNGYFGKVDGGGGSNDFYRGQAMVNVFKPQRRFSAYATTSNTGRTGIEDGDKYGTGSGDEVEGDYGSYYGSGIPLSRAGGMHYDTKWNKNKQSLNVDVKMGSLSTESSTNRQNQQILAASTIRRSSDESNTSYLYRQKIIAAYQTQLDSTSTLKLTLNGNMRNKKTGLTESSLGLRDDNTNLNRSNRSVSDDADERILNSTLLWNKRLKKKGRTLSVNLTENFNNTHVTSLVNSAIEAYDLAGVAYDTTRVDAHKFNHNNNLTLNANINYNEPLSKVLTLAVNYGLNMNNSSTDLKSYNKSGAGQYDILDTEYSNNFDYDQLTNTTGANFNYRKKKTTLAFGTTVKSINQKRLDKYADTKFQRNFINWEPQVRYSYTFRQQKSLSVTYNGRTTQPTINQLQPVKTNNNPQYITIGNPNLNPAFSNSLGLNYNSYKVLSGQSVYLYGSFDFTPDPIANSVITDSQGKRISQSININDKTTMSFYFSGSMSRKLNKSGLQLGLGLNLNGSKYFNFDNNLLNTSRSNTYGGRLSVSKNKLEKYNFNISVGPSYNIGKTSLQSKQDRKTLTVNSDAYFTIYLPGKMEISTEGRYKYTETEGPFSQSIINPIIINSSVSKKFLKSESLKFSISGNDLLKQNTGFSASGYSQSNSTAIQRYFMGSLIWDFSKMGPNKQKK